MKTLTERSEKTKTLGLPFNSGEKSPLFLSVKASGSPFNFGGFSMNRKYVVESWFDNWTVWCLIRNEDGEIIKRKLTDIFPSYKKDEAIAKAELGNYIVKKNTETLKEMVGA